MNYRKLHAFTIFLGDVILLYAALFLTLAVRYAQFPIHNLWVLHRTPMSVLYVFWIVVFYIAGLYETRRFFSLSELTPAVIKAMLINAGLGITIFYTVPFFSITPKISLLIDVIIATALVLFWRRFFLQRLHEKKKLHVLFFGQSAELVTFASTLNSNPQLGYRVEQILLPSNIFDTDLKNIVAARQIALIVVGSNIHEDSKFTHVFFEALQRGVSIINFPDFYEEITGKIPVSEISERWFLENVMETKKQIFEAVRRVTDIFFASLFGIGIFIFFPFIAAAIKIEDGGPIFIRQTRVGKNEKVFTICKFRSMKVVDNATGLAETNGVQWTQKKDPRVTKIGRILRKTHLDELPQMLAILKGDMSFVGPRPERPEFVEQLKKEIPFYNMRHLIKPGFTGWAQINFPAGASVKDALEKLQYDLFYVKNRSTGLDLAIIIKTGKVLFGWGDLA